jgi:amino acid adenylation domain-containing protein
MLQRSGCRSVIVAENSVDQLGDVLPRQDQSLTLLLPDPAAEAYAAQFPRHRFIGFSQMKQGVPEPVPVADENAVAYLLFTSGSTGKPKGVMVSQHNGVALMDWFQSHYDLGPEDRFSQNFALTFDPSVSDMFAAWWSGACLCVPLDREKLKADGYILRSRLTVWNSVPSIAIMMQRMNLLKPGRFPTLRYSQFCGEGLPPEIAQAWSEAAPNSVLDNLYGPTETTVFCTIYRWDPARSPAECVRGLVPIGETFPNTRAFVADENYREVPAGTEGELLIAGDQVTLGYLDDPEKTRASYVIPPGKDETYYRSGDLFMRPAEDAPLVFLGRIDHQVKVRGHRVELGEVEAALRDISGATQAVAIGWPRTSGGAQGLIAFVSIPVDVQEMRRRMAERLPDYMVPNEILPLDRFPLNNNGKVDRKALLQHLEKSA